MRAVFPFVISALLLPGCFWGENESDIEFTVSSSNYQFFSGLLYPTEVEAGWEQMFEARQRHCPDEDDVDDCDSDDRVESGVIQYVVPYDTSRVRGLFTQKSDLQITAHLNMGDVYRALEDDGFGDWTHFSDADEGWGRAGEGCGASLGPYERTGVGPCLKAGVEDNIAAYKGLSEDLRLVILINLPSIDDVRSTVCQDAPLDFTSTDWEYPRTLRINHNARIPVEGTDYYDHEDTRPLSACEVQAFAQLKLGIEVFNADYYGENEQDLDPGERDLLLSVDNASDETLLGTVELESLLLPDDGSDARAVGRYNLAFTSSRFSNLDGSVTISGSFDAEVRRDAEEIDEPEREVDLESAEGGQ
jgi:hypothetical protein